MESIANRMRPNHHNYHFMLANKIVQKEGFPYTRLQALIMDVLASNEKDLEN